MDAGASIKQTHGGSHLYPGCSGAQAHQKLPVSLTRHTCETPGMLQTCSQHAARTLDALGSSSCHLGVTRIVALRAALVWWVLRQ